jgi:enoyl-CoA hydratase/carnithine racemase
MSDLDLCLYEVHGQVAVLTFNRPDRMNGMTGNMELAFYERLRQAEADDDVRAIVITGAGRAWCPGADLAYRPGEGDEPLPNTQIPTTTLLDIRKPTIAAINGACAGMGFALALMCDFRIAAEGAKFTTAFARRGLIAEYGLAWHLVEIAGRATALDLLMTARVLVADDMDALGLVNQVVLPIDVMSVSMALAQDLASTSSPASVATIKRQVIRASSLTEREAMAEADQLMYESLTGADVKEGITSFLDKRPVEFAPLGHGTTFAWMDE